MLSGIFNVIIAFYKEWFGNMFRSRKARKKAESDRERQKRVDAFEPWWEKKPEVEKEEVSSDDK